MGPALPSSNPTISKVHGSAGGWLPAFLPTIFRLLPGLGLLAAVGCAGAPPTALGPEATVLKFSRALDKGEFEEAYELMDLEYRGRVGFEEFKQRLEEDPQETMTLSHALAHISGEAEQEAHLRYSDDGELRLRREEGRWVLADNPVAFYEQNTPRAALRSFVRAMERQRYDVVIRLVPAADKEGISVERMQQAWSGDGREDVERMLENLRTHLDAPIEVVGNRATMPYGDRMRVEFVREQDLWKIEDPE